MDTTGTYQPGEQAQEVNNSGFLSSGLKLGRELVAKKKAVTLV